MSKYFPMDYPLPAGANIPYPHLLKSSWVKRFPLGQFSFIKLKNTHLFSTGSCGLYFITFQIIQQSLWYIFQNPLCSFIFLPFVKHVRRSFWRRGLGWIFLYLLLLNPACLSYIYLACPSEH